MSGLPIPKGRAPLCRCGCGYRTSRVTVDYILGHKPKDPVSRFWANVDRSAPDDCWPWTGWLSKNGYAMFRPEWRGPRVMAHRYAYMLTVGEIPPGLTIDHLCRNRACCNPAHMEPVTRGENARRGGGALVAVAVRQARAERACPSGHPRSPEHARRAKSGHWVCRTCRRETRQRLRREAAA